MKGMKITYKCLQANKNRIGNKDIYYKLFLVRCRKGNHFAIAASSDEDRSVSNFGNNRAKAIDIYFKVVRNGVTPCCLCDIAEDFRNDS